MAYGICELVWPKILLKELGKEIKLSESLYCENNVTISIVHSLIIQCMMLELSIFRNTNTSLMNKSGVAKSVPFFLFSFFIFFSLCHFSCPHWDLNLEPPINQPQPFTTKVKPQEQICTLFMETSFQLADVLPKGVTSHLFHMVLGKLGAQYICTNLGGSWKFNFSSPRCTHIYI